MTRRLLVTATMALVLHAQESVSKSSAVRSWFPDGTGLDIYSDSTNPTHSPSVLQISPQGRIGIAYDRVNRIVLDREHKMLFGYNLKARRSRNANSVFIEIEPLDPRIAADLPGSAGLSTVATVHQFPAVKFGEVITIEILYNPSTGEKIFDVIRPLTETSPYPSRLIVTPAPVREQLSLKSITLRVNGQAVAMPDSWMLGAAARVDIPGHGLYMVSAFDPGNYLFHPVAKADGTLLTWTVDGERVDLSSQTNVLTRSNSGVLWIYHDPHYDAKSLGLQTADSIDWLFPKK